MPKKYFSNKRGVHLYLDSDILKIAQEKGINLSKLLENTLRDQVKPKETEKPKISMNNKIELIKVLEKLKIEGKV